MDSNNIKIADIIGFNKNDHLWEVIHNFCIGAGVNKVHKTVLHGLLHHHQSSDSRNYSFLLSLPMILSTHRECCGAVTLLTLAC
jgi:hypothetical protein